ncbi:hypothetical protein [Serratia fonticola]
MADLPETPGWEAGIKQLEQDDMAEGGAGGMANVQATQLANRTLYLRVLLETLNSLAISSGVGVYESKELAQKAIDDGKELRRFFNVVDIGGAAWVMRYENIGGIATPTGEFMPNNIYIEELSKQVAEIKLTALQKIIVLQEEDGIEFSITDSIGRMLLSLTENGDLKNKTISEILDKLIELAARIGNPLQFSNAGINDANAVVGFIDKEKKLVVGATADGKIISPTVDDIYQRLDLVRAIATGINDYDIVYAWVDSNNKMLVGINSNGELISPTITDIKARLDFIESITGSLKDIRLCGIYGQSNTTGAVNMSQVWRIPAPWGVYPEDYDGPPDGDAVITNHDNGVYTLSSDHSRLIPLVTTAFGVIDGDGPVHGAFDTTKKHYPQYNYMTLGHGRGSSSIDQLDRPTPAEITDGNASGIVIPTTSVEYMMLAAGHGWDRLSLYRYQDCATPYYRGMWLYSHSKMVCALNGFNLVPDTILWLQGENDGNDTEGYADKLIAFYDQYTADIKTIFSYTGKISMIIEQSNYSSTSVTNEQLKINNHFDLNIEQMKAAEKAVTLSPMRSIYLAAPRYPLTNNIHLYPHAQRAHGEQMGKVYRKVNIESQGWKAFTYDFWWLSGNELFIKMRPPVPPLQFVIPLNATSNEMRNGKPYGFSYSGGDLTLSSVQIVGRELIKVSFPDDPRGKSISYLKDVRVGSLCDSDETTPMFTDRWGNPNNMKNYCCPFIIEM